MGLSDKIIIGPLSSPLFVFTPYDVTHQIKSISGTSAVDMVGNNLSIDQLTPTISYPSRMVAEVFAPKGYDGIYTSDGYFFAHILTQPDLRKVPYGTPIYYYRGEQLVGKYYVRSIERTAWSFYKVDAVSAIGLLDRLQHLGGVYNGQRFDAVLNDTIGGVVPFSISADVAALDVYNWLPIATRRQNLHQLLFAYGVAIKRDTNGDMVFDFLSGAAKNVPESHIYNTGSINYSTHATGVEVTEHSYQQLESVAPVVLFDNSETTAAVDAFITFKQAPVFDLQTTGNLTIKSSGVNWAIVSGSGTITGKPYTHLTRIISLQADNVDAREENIIRVSDVTMINRANSYNVANRLLSYYSSARTVTAELSLDGEHSGDLLDFTDPFGEAASGFLERMELSVSSNLKARCTIITDYTPKPETAQFNRVELLTASSGVYTVPDGVFLLRVAIMQAGGGGWSGTDGGEAEDAKYLERHLHPTIGSDSTLWDYLARGGGVGGDAGQPGENGKILIVDIPVTPGQQISFSVGQPGVGGAPGQVSVPGTAGGESTFGTYSSVAGTQYPNGWQEPISGAVYAKPGNPGIAGGKGSGQNEDGELIPGETIIINGVSYSPGASYPTTRKEWEIGNIDVGRLGSFGGGPAYGSDGAPGQDASLSPTTGAPVPGLLGGTGADALPPENASVFGTAGDGGNGGGGAGACGQVGARRTGSIAVNGIIEPAPKAAPGKGTRGADGGPGAIWVYYTDPTTTDT